MTARMSCGVWSTRLLYKKVSYKRLPACLAVCGQHVCSANVSHKRLPACLAVWSAPTGIRRGKSEVSRLLADGYSAPRRKRGRRRRLCPAKCLTLSAIHKKTPYTKVYGIFSFITATFPNFSFLLFPSHFFSLFPELSPPPSRLLFDTPL